MRHKSTIGTSFISLLFLFALIIDTKTAVNGAKSAINLCISAVIPSLFPFLIVSSLVSSIINYLPAGILRPIGKLMRLPKGTEGLFLLGILGGYPIGAQAISKAHSQKALNTISAQRMLGFCNNAGPAFIFGIVGSLFANSIAVWAIWLIHITSCIVVGAVLPGRADRNHHPAQTTKITIAQSVENSVKVMGIICGWIVIFRVILSYLQRWFLWLLPEEFRIWTIGITELANGIFDLYAITSPGQRFIIASGILGFGGICVAMQTVSVTKGLGTGYYFPGKVLQSAISIILAYFTQHFLFKGSELCQVHVPFFIVVLSVLVITLIAVFKRDRKNSSIYEFYHV